MANRTCPPSAEQEVPLSLKIARTLVIWLLFASLAAVTFIVVAVALTAPGRHPDNPLYVLLILSGSLFICSWTIPGLLTFPVEAIDSLRKRRRRREEVAWLNELARTHRVRRGSR